MRLRSLHQPIIAGLLTFGFFAAMPAYAQGIRSGAPGGGEDFKYSDRVFWFNNPDVLAEMKMSREQRERLDLAVRNYWNGYVKSVEELNLDEELAEMERLKKLEAYHELFQKNVSASLDEILTDRVSRRRYDELYTQYQGYGAFHNPAVQRKLGLTSEQKHMIREFDLEWNKELKQIHADFEKNRPVAMRELKHARRLMKERIEGLLTPDQRVAWLELTGKPYEFPDEMYAPQPPAAGIKSTNPPPVANPPTKRPNDRN